MADGATEFINRMRETAARTALNNQAQLGASRIAIQASPNGDTANASGYWNGAGYVDFFTFGLSKLGGADVME